MCSDEYLLSWYSLHASSRRAGPWVKLVYKQARKLVAPDKVHGACKVLDVTKTSIRDLKWQLLGWSIVCVTSSVSVGNPHIRSVAIVMSGTLRGEIENTKLKTSFPVTRNT